MGKLIFCCGKIPRQARGSFAGHQKTCNPHRFLQVYLLTYLSGGREVVNSMEELPASEDSWENGYLAWNDTLMWASDLKLTTEFSNQGRPNPFVGHALTFEKQITFLQEVGHRLGTFQSLECKRLKNQ